jgi:hypothetical protein
MMPLLVFLFGLAAVSVIDVGMLLTDRRDAQNDADKVALAAALELTLNPDASAADTAAALAVGQDWAESNGITAIANTGGGGGGSIGGIGGGEEPTDAEVLSIEVIHTCYGDDPGFPTGIRVTIARTPGNFLVGMLPVTTWRSTATAVACAGRPIEMTGFLPFALSMTSDCFETEHPSNDRVVIYGSFCDIRVDQNTTGLVGELGFETSLGSPCDAGNSSADVLHANIVDGVVVTCSSDPPDSVIGNAGHNVGATKAGIADRLATEGACDAPLGGEEEGVFWSGPSAITAAGLDPLLTDFYGNYGHSNGVDDFYEIWTWQDANFPVTGLIEICKSPRNVNLIVVEDLGTSDGDAGPKSYLVRGFARMYIEGCTSDLHNAFYADCDWSGIGNFTIHARYVEQVSVSNAAIGLTDESFGTIEVFLME